MHRPELDPAGEGVLGTYAAYLPPLYRANAQDYLASLRKLRALRAPDLVLPGHPRMDPVPQDTHGPIVLGNRVYFGYGTLLAGVIQRALVRLRRQS